MEIFPLLLLLFLGDNVIAKELLGFELTSFVDEENKVTVVSNNTNVNFEAGLTICFRAKIQFWIERTILFAQDQVDIGLYGFRNDINEIYFHIEGWSINDVRVQKWASICYDSTIKEH